MRLVEPTTRMRAVGSTPSSFSQSAATSRALGSKVHAAAEGAAPGPVTTDDLVVAVDDYRRVRGVVEKIRYGQYL